MARSNTYLPDGTMAASAALRVLRERPGAKLVLSAGNFFVVPSGGRIAKPKAHALIRRHLTVVDRGLFVGHPLSWAYPRNPPIKRYRTFLRSVGKRIARRGRDPHETINDQRRAVNAVLHHFGIARIAASEAPLDAIVRAYQMTRASDADVRQMLALCAAWVNKRPSKRRAPTKRQEVD